MVSTTQPSRLASTTFLKSACSAIAHYLNTAIALQPPLTVTGHPPKLNIYVSSRHLCSIASVLSQIETRLRVLQALKYWEIDVYVEDTSPPRLIHHALLEKVSFSACAGMVDGRSRLPNGEWQYSALFQTPFAGSLERNLQFEDSFQDGRPVVRRQRNRRNLSRVTVGTVSITLASFAVGVGLSEDGRSQISRWSHLLRFNTRTAASSTRLSQLPADQPSTISTTPKVEESNIFTLPSFPISSSGPDGAVSQPLTPESSSGSTTDVLSTNTPATVTAVKLKAVGDIIPGTNYPDYRIPQNPEALFESVKMFMGEVDILFGNFESTLTTHPYSAKDVSQGMTFAFRTPPEFAAVLQTAGFDVLSVANNHSFDFGDVGFEDTIAHINRTGMKTVGRKDEIIFLEANGHTVAFIGFSYWDAHNSMLNLERAIALVRSAQSQANMVVISVHAGAEGTDAMAVRNETEYFFSENRGNMVQFSHAMVDAGADLILGHGPHVPRAIELYQDKLIAYSLGNFLGYRTLSTVGALGKSLILQVELDREGNFVTGRVIPVALDQNGIPYIDNFFDSVSLIRRLTQQDFPNTLLEIDQMGHILRTD